MNKDDNKNQKLEETFAEALGVGKEQLKGVFDGKDKEPSTPVHPETFDESAYYDKEIWPRMQELDKLCRDHGLPHLLWVISSHREDGATGNGLISATQHPCASKMAVLANIADGTMSLSMLAKMAMLHSLMGGDSK